MEKNKIDKKEQDALDYHSKGRPGKIEVTSTKACLTARDLSLAYTPGVAAPCLKIAKDSDESYRYTAKGNLVGVISNGSAVLGLGNIGPDASKPVMEGKGILFKRFADVDVFDIEINESTVEGMVRVIGSLGPTFGGINLEDIKAPECFEVERQLIEKMNIPVFHDDQHGTAIIAAAGFVNAIEITDRDIKKVKVVFSGAGAASMACAKLFIKMGVNPNNLLMTDSKGVIYSGRTNGMNSYKEEFAITTKTRTLADALKKADAFIGCSAKGVLTQEMVKTMSDQPIIFAMANPDPEIDPKEVYDVRPDAIMATGRSDYPNQVNNVLGFPFIFRGALDVRATKINEEMKMAAVYALANLAKAEVPEEVKDAYSDENFTFGPKYIIPKPFDSRVLTHVAPAVAKAAMDSGVARKEIKDLTKYAEILQARLGGSAAFMNSIRARLPKDKKTKILFAEGSNDKILQAISIILEEKKIEPILLGNNDTIRSKIKALGLKQLQEVQIINPKKDKNYEKFYTSYYQTRQRKGVSKHFAKELMGEENYFGSMLLNEGLVDGMITGATQTYPECIPPIMNIIGTKNNRRAAGIIILIFKNRILFLADCTLNILPSATELSLIALSAADFYRKIMLQEPNVAFLSFSNFGSNQDERARKVAQAVEYTHQADPSLVCDGELQADVAINKKLRDRLFPFSTLDQSTNVVIFPDLTSANISYKMLAQLSDARPIGPLIIPMNKSVSIVQRTSTVSEIVNMATLTTLLAQEE